MFEILKPEIIIFIISLLAWIFVILGNFFQLRDRFKKWYLIKTRKVKYSSKSEDYPLTLLNFAHPITQDQKIELEKLLKSKLNEIYIPTQLDHSLDFEVQIKALVNSTKISSDRFQKGDFIVNLPGFSPAVGTLVAELHGRMGHFPTIIRLKPVDGSAPIKYEVAQVINLQCIRDASRECR